MVQINFAKSEVQCKVVYYGPPCSGKTTNLRSIHERSPEHVRGALTSIATDTNRTLFFDFLPLNLGDVAGIKTKIHVYAVPYIANQPAMRLLVLEGVDGIVFVADSSAHALEANNAALRDLHENLAQLGRDLSDIPVIWQWNKSDLPDAMSAEQLDAALNPEGRPSFSAVAEAGNGVFATLKGITQSVLVDAAKLVSTQRQPPEADQAAEQAPAPAQQAPAPTPAPTPAPLPPVREPVPTPDPAPPAPTLPVVVTPAPPAPLPEPTPAPEPVPAAAAALPPLPVQPLPEIPEPPGDDMPTLADVPHMASPSDVAYDAPTTAFTPPWRQPVSAQRDREEADADDPPTFTDPEPAEAPEPPAFIAEAASELGAAPELEPEVQPLAPAPNPWSEPAAPDNADSEYDDYAFPTQAPAGRSGRFVSVGGAMPVSDWGGDDRDAAVAVDRRKRQGKPRMSGRRRGTDLSLTSDLVPASQIAAGALFTLVALTAVGYLVHTLL